MLLALAWPHVENSLLSLWFVGCLAGQLANIGLLRALSADNMQNTAARLRYIAIANIVNGLLHGALLSLFSTVLPPFNQVLIIMLLTAYTVAGMGLCMGYLPIYLGYLVPVMGQVGIGFWFAEHLSIEWRLLMAASVLVYCGFLIGVSRNVFKVFSSAVNERERTARLNGELEQALDQASSANMAKTRFLASASHDLRQPLHALSLFTTALSLQHLDASSEQISRHLDTAVGALSTQLDALLDISKLDAGVFKAAFSSIDLVAMLQRLLHDFSGIAAEQGLRLKVDLPASAWVHTDAVLLERIVRNLMANAFKYTRNGGIELLVVERETGVELQLTDTGQGIPAAEQSRVFDEFYQIENPERNKSKGLGLGLAIVRRLCVLLNIEIEMQSELGVGTHFVLRVPLCAKVEARITPHDQPLDTAAINACILVIDDEPEVLMGMRSVLEALGCSVLTASDIGEALLWQQRKTPDIVLADFRLRGDEDGLQAIAQLRQTQSNLPALLVSGDTAPDRLREADKAGVIFLHKPVRADELQRHIKQLLTSQKPL